MPLKLILMRHAKSSWGDLALDDFDRPLNTRGRDSALAVGQWLVAEDHLPEVVQVSSACRTTETWARMAHLMPANVEIKSNAALYHAGADTILNIIRKETAGCLMVICHNPGIADFAARIAMRGNLHPRFNDYPTAATAIIEFSADAWHDIGWGKGQITDFTIPRELLP